MPQELPAFMLVTVLLMISPGPDMALILRNGTLGGTRRAWRTAQGCLLGITFHSTAAVLGLSALLALSATAFTLVKTAGAAYLLYLGARMLWSARRGAPAGTPPPDTRADPAAARHAQAADRAAFRQGLLCNLLNPKIALLFLTLLPQFVAPGEARVPTSIELAVAFLALSVVWWRAFALFTGQISHAMRRPRVRQWIDRATGCVLIGLGFRVALEHP